VDIIHRPVFYLNHNVSETGFCLRLQVEPTQLGPTDKSNLSADYWAQLSRFHLKTETESSFRNVVVQIKDRTMDNVQNFSTQEVPNLSKIYSVKRTSGSLIS
jgi:hypothetical protein